MPSKHRERYRPDAVGLFASGLRRWTKQEEMKESTNLSSLNVRIRYALSSSDSLLTTAIFSPEPSVEPPLQSCLAKVSIGRT